MKERIPLKQEKLNPRECFWWGCLGGLYVAYFAVFMLPESVLSNLHADILYAKIYPEIVSHVIENNIIKPTIFPMAAYIFWCIAPFVIISVFAFFISIMWSERRIEIFISRRKDEKTIYFCVLFGVVASIGSLFVHDPSGPLAWAFKPFQNKIPFFIIYISVISTFSISIAFFVENVRARIYLNRRK